MVTRPGGFTGHEPDPDPSEKTMQAVQFVGLVLVVVGLILLVVPRMGSESKVVVPGVTIDAPASVLVLLVGVAVFLFPYSPWWPSPTDGPQPSSTAGAPSPTTSAALPTSEPSISPSAPPSTSPLASVAVSATPSIPPAQALPASVVSDCIPYDPATLAIEDLGADGWRLNSSTSAMLLTDNSNDAQKALKLAQLQTQHCFIGRDNTRPNRLAYIVTFWSGHSGTIVKIPAGAIPDEDCTAYDPGNLSTEDLGDLGWRLNSGSIAMVLVDNADDASKLQELASHYSQQCFIGRDNNRADRYRYIVDYWK